MAVAFTYLLDTEVIAFSRAQICGPMKRAGQWGHVGWWVLAGDLLPGKVCYMVLKTEYGRDLDKVRYFGKLAEAKDL